MDFINQVKKLKELTKSPEVKSLCESFLNGESVSKDELIASINEHNNSGTTQNDIPNVINHIEAIRKEENEVSKRSAAALMESWGGLGSRTSSNSGSYADRKEQEEKKENLEQLKNMIDKGRVLYHREQADNAAVLVAHTKLQIEKAKIDAQLSNNKKDLEKIKKLVNQKFQNLPTILEYSYGDVLNK